MSISKVHANLKRRVRGKSPAILLPFPVSSTLRLAQLSPGPKFENVQPFVLKRWSDVRVFGPNVAIGTFGEMQRLMGYLATKSIDASSIDRALVVLTRFGSKPLNDVSRVALWQAFGVPIFELYLGLDHALLASECEAHEGWHLAPGIRPMTLDTGELVLDGAGNSGLRTGLRGAVDQTTCPCGLTSPRVLEIEQMPRLESNYLAVTA